MLAEFEMDSHGCLNESCVVRLRQQDGIKTPSNGCVEGDKPTQQEFSCSGVVIEPKEGLILTSGLVFAETLKKKPHGLHSSKKLNISTKRQTEDIPFYTASSVSQFLIDVVLPESSASQPLPTNPPSSSTVQGQRPLPATCRTVTRRADLIILWKCQDFDDILKTFLPQRDGWEFSDSKEGSVDQSDQTSERDAVIGAGVEPIGLSSVSKNLPEESFISWFALLKLRESERHLEHLGHPIEFLRSLSLQDDFSVRQGNAVCLRATPFGATCPSVFLNSLSMGVVSNVAGPRHQLIMTDARCIPGAEGGGMYLNNSKLAGIIVAPLCWKNNEWIGLTLVCSLRAIIESLSRVIDSRTKDVNRAITSSVSSDFTAERLRTTKKLSLASYPSLIQQCMRSVALIKVSGVWGSGVIINAKKGLILTCRHVVYKAESLKVQVCLDYPYIHWKYAAVIYMTRHNSPLDLAVLQLEGGVGVLSEAFGSTGKRTAKSCSQGQPVFVVGHALLAPERDLLPSVSAGVMSKVISVRESPIMLQSTCAVHSGTSGGPLFCGRTGQLLGIVTSNARDMDSGASFPHINFIIPWSIFGPILTEFLHTEDLKVLGKLDSDDEFLTSVWSLDERRIMENIQSKL
ncbi:peroxisomal leader peptide-processing protease-like [Asterias rubens]|uniref:peroxisomal leader peptide-processing protease-like n=1 Tax=Asterias rubens TaxID=7604 RepID=UPI001454ED26|nr:peroxisomal leader peptide-processing protease-like [Asterias rubens]